MLFMLSTESAPVAAVSRQLPRASRAELRQLIARRQARKIVWDGEEKPLADWAQDLGLPYATLYQRVKRWGVHRAFTQPYCPNYIPRPQPAEPASPEPTQLLLPFDALADAPQDC